MHGLSLDGLIYATIARNLALYKGSFWLPHFSSTFFSEFYEHPPLGLWLESGFFRLFGDGFYIEQVYSAVMLALTLLIMGLIWARVNLPPYYANHYWLVALLFLVIPLVTYTFRNNYLENQLVIVTTSAVLTQLYALDKSGWRSLSWGAISGLLICMGILIKGPVALFPLVAAWCYWIVFRSPGIKQVLSISLVAIIVIALFVAALFLNPKSNHFIHTYFNQQIISTMTGQRKVDYSRIFVVKTIAKSLIYPFIILGIVFLLHWLLIGKQNVSNRNNIRYVFFFFLIALCASLPLMVSPRQYKHYLLPSLPFYALGMASLALSLVNDVVGHLGNRVILRKSLAWLAVALTLIALVLGVGKFGGLNGDSRFYLPNVHEIARIVGDGNRVWVCDSLINEFKLIAYLARYHAISVERSGDYTQMTSNDYLLCDQENLRPNLENLEKTTISLTGMTLWQSRR